MGGRNWAAAAQERVQFTPEEIHSAREIMILQGYKVTEGTVLKWLMDSGLQARLPRYCTAIHGEDHACGAAGIS